MRKFNGWYLALLLLALPGSSAWAQMQTQDEDVRLYDVEVILFENLDVTSSGDERWKPQVSVPTFADTAAFEPGNLRTEDMIELPRGFQTLPSQAATLMGTVERLEESPRYRVIRHLLWRQPGLEAGQAVPLRFHAGDPVVIDVPRNALNRVALGPEPETDESQGSGESGGSDAAGPSTDDSVGDLPPSTAAMIPSRVETRVYPLDGTIRVVVSRYIHVHADFYYTTEVEWDENGANDDRNAQAGSGSIALMRPEIARGPGGEAMLSYPFSQRRRMRSGELHYLDNPVLGMLVVVRRSAEEQDNGNEDN